MASKSTAESGEVAAAVAAAAAAARSAGLAAQAAATMAHAVLELAAHADTAGVSPPPTPSAAVAGAQQRLLSMLSAFNPPTDDPAVSATDADDVDDWDACMGSDGSVETCDLSTLHRLLIAAQHRVDAAQEEYATAVKEVEETEQVATLAERKLRACHSLNTLDSHDPLSQLITRCLQLADRLVHADMHTIQQEMSIIAHEAQKVISVIRDKILSSGVISHIAHPQVFSHLTPHLPHWASDWMHSIQARVTAYLPIHAFSHHTDSGSHHDPTVTTDSTIHDTPLDSTSSHVLSSTASSSEAVTVSQGAGASDPSVLDTVAEEGTSSSMSSRAHMRSAVSAANSSSTLQPTNGSLPRHVNNGTVREVLLSNGSVVPVMGRDGLPVNASHLINLASSAVNLGHQLGVGEGIAEVFTQLSALTSMTMSKLVGSLAAVAGGTTSIALDVGAFLYNSVSVMFTFAVDFGLFVATLLYLLSSGEEPMQRIIFLLPLDKKHQEMADQALSHAMRAVFLSSLKLAFFHAGFTWITLRAASTHFTTLLTLCSTIIAILPVLPVWAPVVPAALELALTYGQYAQAVILLAVQVVVSGWVDDVIMGEMGGGGYLTGFGVAGGMAVWSNPLKGVLLGPMCLALASAAYHLHGQFVEMEGDL